MHVKLAYNVLTYRRLGFWVKYGIRVQFLTLFCIMGFHIKIVSKSERTTSVRWKESGRMRRNERMILVWQLRWYCYWRDECTTDTELDTRLTHKSTSIIISRDLHTNFDVIRAQCIHLNRRRNGKFTRNTHNFWINNNLIIGHYCLEWRLLKQFFFHSCFVLVRFLCIRSFILCWRRVLNFFFSLLSNDKFEKLNAYIFFFLL